MNGNIGRVFAAAALGLGALLVVPACSGNSSSSSGSTGSTGSTGTTSQGTTSGGSSSTGSTTGSTTGGSSAGTSGSSGGSTGGSTTYCDGFAVGDPDAGEVLVQTYAFHDALAGCKDQLQADGGPFTTVGGIWDLDILDNGSSTPAETIFPAGCDDFGLAAGPSPDGGSFSVPDGGAMTVAAAVAAQSTSANIYGVVTAIEAWNPSASAAQGGTVYLEDPVAAGGTPAPHSGISVYVPKAVATTLGATIPARGDVVELTNVKWSPYKGQNQLAATSTSQLVPLGSAPLPPPVSLPASQLGPTSTNDYEGMRVTVSGGPFTVQSGACPAPLEYTSQGGG